MVCFRFILVGARWNRTVSKLKTINQCWMLDHWNLECDTCTSTGTYQSAGACGMHLLEGKRTIQCVLSDYGVSIAYPNKTFVQYN